MDLCIIYKCNALSKIRNRNTTFISYDNDSEAQREFIV